MGTTGQYNMGLGFGLDSQEVKRKFRWLFKLYGISAYDDPQNGVFSLPPRRSSRPSLSWKEETVQHLTETITYPFKPEWKTMQLTLFDLNRCGRNNQCNVVFDWLRKSSVNRGAGMYNPQSAQWRPIVSSNLKRNAELLILDCCGFTMERWVLENCYPQSIDWGELEMDLNDVLTIDVTIKFDRAYQLC